MMYCGNLREYYRTFAEKNSGSSIPDIFLLPRSLNPGDVLRIDAANCMEQQKAIPERWTVADPRGIGGT